MEQLPVRYRIVVWVVGVSCFAGLGGWSAVLMASAASGLVPLVGPLVGGAVLGGLLGALLVLVFLHALEPSEVRARATSSLR